MKRQNYMKRRILSIIIMTAMLLSSSLSSFSSIKNVRAADDSIVLSGTCGDSAYYEIGKDSCIRVYGTGSMNLDNILGDYGKKKLNLGNLRLVVEEGIISVEGGWPSGLVSGELCEIVLPSTLESIKEGLFYHMTQLRKIVNMSQIDIVLRDDNWRRFSELPCGLIWKQDGVVTKRVSAGKTAEATPRTFKIIYHKKGGTISKNAPHEYTYPNKVKLPTMKKKGWTFYVWRGRLLGKSYYKYSYSYNRIPEEDTGDIELKACYQKIKVKNYSKGKLRISMERYRSNHTAVVDIASRSDRKDKVHYVLNDTYGKWIKCEKKSNFAAKMRVRYTKNRVVLYLKGLKKGKKYYLSFGYLSNDMDDADSIEEEIVLRFGKRKVKVRI